MDREAWRAAVHGVVKSWTRLRDWTELNHAQFWCYWNRDCWRRRGGQPRTDPQSPCCVGLTTSPTRAMAAAEPAAPILLDFSAAFGNHWLRSLLTLGMLASLFSRYIYLFKEGNCAQPPKRLLLSDMLIFRSFLFMESSKFKNRRDDFTVLFKNHKTNLVLLRLLLWRCR